MKNLIKIVIVVGALVAIFGGATVKGWLTTGLDKGVDAISVGVDKLKSSDTVKQVGSDVANKAKSAAGDLVSKALEQK